jgi:hypothetical protein
MVIFFVLALIGIASILVATSAAVGVSSDSIVYVDSARHLAYGQGYFTRVDCGVKAPVVKWPPLFPMILSTFHILDIDPLQGARGINAVLFGANILSVGVLMYKFTRGALYIPILGSFLTLSSTVMLNVHSMAWAEPLFIFLGFLGLFLLTLYIQNERPSYLLAGSVVIALAYLDRYIGITLVVTGIIGLLCLSQRKLHRRLVDSAIFAVISTFPMALLNIRNYHLTGYAAGDRTTEPITLERLDSLVISISSWLFPGSEIFNLLPAQDTVIRILLIIIFLTLLFMSVRLLWMEPGRSGGKAIKLQLASTPVLFLIFAVVYIALLTAVVAFFDSSVQLDNRMLSPVFVALLILVLYLLHMFFHYGVRRHLQLALLLIGAAFAMVYLAAGAFWITYSHFNGRQYTNKVWQALEISKELEVLPPQTLIFSNHHKFVYFETARPACPIEYLNSFDTSGLIKLSKEHADVVVVQFDIEPKYAFKNEFPYTSRREMKLEERFSARAIVERTGMSIYKITPKIE